MAGTGWAELVQQWGVPVVEPPQLQKSIAALVREDGPRLGGLHWGEPTGLGGRRVRCCQRRQWACWGLLEQPGGWGGLAGVERGAKGGGRQRSCCLSGVGSVVEQPAMMEDLLAEARVDFSGVVLGPYTPMCHGYERPPQQDKGKRHVVLSYGHARPTMLCIVRGKNHRCRPAFDKCHCH